MRHTLSPIVVAVVALSCRRDQGFGIEVGATAITLGTGEYELSFRCAWADTSVTATVIDSDQGVVNVIRHKTDAMLARLKPIGIGNATIVVRCASGTLYPASDPWRSGVSVPVKISSRGRAERSLGTARQRVSVNHNVIRLSPKTASAVVEIQTSFTAIAPTAQILGVGATTHGPITRVRSRTLSTLRVPVTRTGSGAGVLRVRFDDAVVDIAIRSM